MGRPWAASNGDSVVRDGGAGGTGGGGAGVAAAAAALPRPAPAAPARAGPPPPPLPPAAGVAGRGGIPSRADGAAGSLRPPHSLSAASRFALSSRRTRRIALTSASAARLREA